MFGTVFGYPKIRRGCLYVGVKEATGRHPQKALTHGVAFVAQGRCNFPNMTVRENLGVACYKRRDRAVTRDIEATIARSPSSGKKSESWRAT